MKVLGFDITKASEKRASPEDQAVPVSAENFLAFFGVSSANLPNITIDTAMTVPAFADAVDFLSACLASLPLNAFRVTDNGAERIRGGVNAILNEAPNDEWTSFGWRKYYWQQVFTGGRGLSWLEWSGNTLANIWPMDPSATTVKFRMGRKVYELYGREYPADEVIDVPFYLKRDMISVDSPLRRGAKALQLAIAMNDYASAFFAGGGVPPLALKGPLPAGPDAIKRAQSDIKRSIDAAKNKAEPVFPIPAGYDLTPVGIDPAKGQMIEARLFQIQEIARLFGLPPVFLQDLSKGTFSNTEQQDLHLVKHTIAQWAKAFEEEINLKIFGRRSRGGRFAEHNLDGLMRGDFKSRIEGIVRAVQGGLLEPNRGRDLMNWPKHSNPMADDLFMQGATVPLGTTPTATDSGTPQSDEDGEGDEPGETDADATA